MMTSVYSASDSISTRPSSNVPRMTAAAPGLRAIASAAEATALPCASAQRPEAMAIEKPDVRVNPVPSAANVGAAKTNSASTIMKILAFIVFLLQVNSLQEVVPGGVGTLTVSHWKAVVQKF